MLSTNSDRRWLIEREDTPRYPTMRLLRQTTPGDWGGVVERLLAALSQCPEQLMART
jgi:hypothetical protein